MEAVVQREGAAPPAGTNRNSLEQKNHYSARAQDGPQEMERN